MVQDTNFVLEESPLAVHGQGISVYLDRKKKIPILKNIDIAVGRGTIYSLLGPSGCGKTTLVKCIVGQQRIQEGYLKTFGRSPGSRGFFIPGPGVGYMPQDLALYTEMTIEETLSYFGKLFLMKPRTIKERMSFLLSFLGLPDKRKQVKCLSGGQQRCVSFAAALIHKPPLLILDEPTVGADPVLSKAIWDHLVRLTKIEAMSIIITTHSVEEARQVHIIGLMREGHLVVEKTPDDLIKQHGVFALTEAYFKIYESKHNKAIMEEAGFGRLTSVESFSVNNSAENKDIMSLQSQYANGMNAEHGLQNDADVDDEELVYSNGNHKTTTALLEPFSMEDKSGYVGSITGSYIESWQKFGSMFGKNMLLIRKKIFNTIFLTLIPATIGLLYFLCVGRDLTDLPVAVVNMEKDPHGLANTYLRYLQKKAIRQKPYDNLNEAIESIKNGENWGALYFDQEFTACLLDRSAEGIDVTNETLICSQVNLYMDMSDAVVFTMIIRDVFYGFQSFVTDMLEGFGKNPLIGEGPFKIHEGIYGTTDNQFTSYIAPGMLMGLSYLMPLMMAEMSILLEKKKGLFHRSLVAGATATQIFLSLFAVMLFVIVMQIILVLVVSFGIFHIPCAGSHCWVVVILLITGISGTCNGFLISSIFDDENVALFSSVGTHLLYCALCGLAWPIQGMPVYLRKFVYFLPLTQMNGALQSVLGRGWSLLDHQIWDGCVIMFIWTAVYVILTILALKIRK